MTEKENEYERVGIVSQRLASLMDGGIGPREAFNYLTKFSSFEFRRVGKSAISQLCYRVLSRLPPILWRFLQKFYISNAETKEPFEIAIARKMRSGRNIESITAQSSLQAWRVFGSVWKVSFATGAPIAGALRSISQCFFDIGNMQRDISSTLAGPVATAKMISFLPLFGLVFGTLLGQDVLGFLFGKPVGWLVLFLGFLFILLGIFWTKKLVAGFYNLSEPFGFVFELTALGLRGGVDPKSALYKVEEIVKEFGLPSQEVKHVRGTLQLAQQTGVAVGALLQQEANLARLKAVNNMRTFAARLGVRLMLPLGVCFLPAFILLGVLPLLFTMLNTL